MLQKLQDVKLYTKFISPKQVKFSGHVISNEGLLMDLKRFKHSQIGELLKQYMTYNAS